MPIEALTKAQLESQPSTRRLHQEYVAFLSSARLGTGGRLYVAKEGTSRLTIKNRLKAAADHVGKKIAFQRSPAEQVVFQVVE